MSTAGKLNLFDKSLGLFGTEKIRAALGKNGGGGGGSSAQEDYAALTREQWQSYITNFVPYENKLIEYATDPSVVSNAMSGASADVNAAFDSRAAGTARHLGGLGLTLDADEQRASTRSLGLARSLTDVGAQNAARDATVARQQSILGNPMPTLKGLG
jgi:hypothetical protein